MMQYSLIFWLLSMVTLLWINTGHCEDIARSCCSANLMDSGDRVVIDTLMARRGYFNAIKVLMCTTTLTYVQLWRHVGPANSTTYELLYQWNFHPSTLSEYTLQFEEETFISEDIKLGLFSPGSDKHNVPYIFSSSSSYTLISKDKYNSTDQLPVGGVIEVDLVVYPRTFRYNAILCVDRECEDVVSLLPLVLPGPPGPPGPPGAAGPQGQPCSIIDTPMGDAVGGINDQVNDIKSDTQRLEDLVTDISNKVSELTQANFVTGTCPPGYLSGSYGIGSCYVIFRSKRVQFAEAHFTCVEKYRGTIVDIYTDLEQTYLRNTITQLIASSGDGDTESFWTSGMYSDELLQWVWYDEVRRLPVPMVYENWYSELARSSQGGLKICLKLVIDARSNQSYWMSDYCESRNFFICKVEKKCL